MTVETIAKPKPERWEFDSQDHRREGGGFEGRCTHVSGITSRTFASEAQAIARMVAKVIQCGRWRYIGALAGFDHVWRHESGPWFLCLHRVY